MKYLDRSNRQVQFERHRKLKNKLNEVTNHMHRY